MSKSLQYKMSKKRVERGFYELTEDKEKHENSFAISYQKVEETPTGNDIVTKETTVTEQFSIRPNSTNEMAQTSSLPAKFIKTFAKFNDQIRNFEQLKEELPGDAESLNNEDTLREDAPNGHSCNVDMGAYSKCTIGDRNCTTKDIQKVEATNFTTAGSINTDNTRKGARFIKMEESSKCKMGNTDCKTTESIKIVADKVVTGGSDNGESESITNIEMKKGAEFEMGDKGCVKETEVDIHTETYKGGFGLQTGSGGDVNINVGENSIWNGGLVPDSKEEYTKKNGIIEDWIYVKSSSEFEELSQNKAGAVKKLSMEGDWIVDLDEFTLEDQFKTFVNLVDLRIHSPKLSDMPPISCLDRLRSLDISKCDKISPASFLRQLSSVKCPLKSIVMAMANGSLFRYKELLKVARYVENADHLDIGNCCSLCPNEINHILERTNIQTLKVTKCLNCRDCTELKGKIGEHIIKGLKRVQFV